MIKCEDYCGAKDVQVMGDAKTLTKEFGLIVAALKCKLPDDLLHEIIDSENVTAFSNTIKAESSQSYKTFKLRVSHLMEINGYTRVTLAKALGIPYHDLQIAMSSGVIPDTILVEKLADFFGVPLEYLFKAYGEKE